MKTESEKSTEAAIESAKASKKSAQSARISLIISLSAIFVAVATLIFNIYSALYKYDDLKATILNASPFWGTCSLNIIFSNNGNQQCSIALVNLIQTYYGNIDGAGPRTNEIVIPFSDQPAFSLKPNEIISKQFTINRNVTESGFINLKNGEKRDWLLGFCVIDSTGKYHVVKVPIFWKI